MKKLHDKYLASFLDFHGGFTIVRQTPDRTSNKTFKYVHYKIRVTDKKKQPMIEEIFQNLQKKYKIFYKFWDGLNPEFCVKDNKSILKLIKFINKHCYRRETKYFKQETLALIKTPNKRK